jgi:hypothetical protein
MVQRCKFSIELKNFPPDLSGEPNLPSYASTKKDIKKSLAADIKPLLSSWLAQKYYYLFIFCRHSSLFTSIH